MKKNILKEAGVLTVVALMVLSTVVTANTTNLSEKEENAIPTDGRVARENLISPLPTHHGGKTVTFSGPAKAYCAYSGALPEGPVEFNLPSPGTITLLAPTSSNEFLAGGTWAAGTTWNGWYGCQFTDGKLYKIHPITGSMTLIGGGGAGLNGLAYDPVSEKMYGASSYDLYEIDAAGGQTLKGSFGTGGLMIGIAFTDGGTLYGVDIITDSLYTVSTGGGTATFVGSLGIDISYAQDMAYDIDNSIMYLSAYEISPDYGGILYTVSLVDATVTPVGHFQGDAEITCFAIPYGPPCDIEIDSIHAGSDGKDVYVDVSNNGGVDLIGVPWTMTFTVTGGPGSSPGILGRPPGGVASGTIDIPTSGATIYFDDVSGKAEFDLTVIVGCADEIISGVINGKKIIFY